MPRDCKMQLRGVLDGAGPREASENELCCKGLSH